jgi:energy-coupling factor transport system ATP-binding protein
VALTTTDIGYDYSAGTGFQYTALNGVSFSVGAGELVLVVGATGSGKSTLLKMLSGLLEPTRGSILLDEAPLTSATARGAVGLVFQDAESQLFAETVLSDVEFGPRNLGLDGAIIRASARAAMESVGLDPDTYAERSPFGLSGGEARRVAIAGVLAMSPRYLLLDEPTAGLDALGRAAVREAVRSARQGAGVVVVSHTAEEFLGAADRVVMLSAGEVAFCGTAREVIDNPTLFATAGLRAPEVLQVLQAARDTGIEMPRFSLDPETAARTLMDAGAWTR